MKWADEDKARAKEAYERGESAADVARTIGCTKDTVYKWLKSAGVVVRPRGRYRRRS